MHVCALEKLLHGWQKAFSSEKEEIKGKKSCVVSFFPLGNSYIDIIIERHLKNFNSFKFKYFNFIFWFQELGLLRTDYYWKVTWDLPFKKIIFKILLSVANSARESITLSCENQSWPLHSFHIFAAPIKNNFFTL